MATGWPYTRSTLGKDGRFTADIRTVGEDGSGDALFRGQAEGGAWSPGGSRFAYGGIRCHHGETCGSDECAINAELPERSEAPRRGAAPRSGARGCRPPSATSFRLASATQRRRVRTWVSSGREAMNRANAAAFKQSPLSVTRKIGVISPVSGSVRSSSCGRPSSGLLFYRLLEQAVATDPRPYDTLITAPATYSNQASSRVRQQRG